MADSSSQKILKTCETYVKQSLAGLEIESPKVDFKTKWYELKSDIGANEFIKDITSIANTVGLDGYIILGYDEKAKKIVGTKFKDSGLKDSNELQGVIIRRCSHLFDLAYYEFKFKTKVIGIIHIPPVLDKPVLIRNYRTFHSDGTPKPDIDQRIFVRKGTSIHVANKNDIDLMYYDRKNLTPEYEYSLDIIKLGFKADDIKLRSYNPNYKIKNEINLSLTLENTGRRNITVKKSKIELSETNTRIQFDKVTLHYNGKVMNWDGSKAVVFETGKTAEFRVAAYETNLDKPTDIALYDELVIILVLSSNKQLVNSYNPKEYL